jgi:hypothetical protein
MLNEKILPTLASIIFIIKIYGISHFAMKPLNTLGNLIQCFMVFFPSLHACKKFLIKVNYLLYLSDTMPKHVFYG